MPKTLLLADESVTIQRVIELTFSHEDVRVVSVSDGRRALQWMETEWPDIVLVDVEVPEVDGYAVCAHVKQSPRLKGVPVLLLAGAFEPVDEARVRSIGCDGVLVKPFEPQQLVSRVKELLGGAPGKAAAPSSEPSRGEPATVTPFPVPAGPLRVAHGALDDTGGSVPQPLELPTRPIWETAGDRSSHRPAEPGTGSPLASGKVSLASAFSALLAAEAAAPPPSPGPPPAVNDAAIEQAVRRVLAQMTEETVRSIVHETAERLVREEIERINASSQ
jgi:CheY-like chemotaxis protein